MTPPTYRRSRHRRGFTLIELLVVLVILGLVSAFAAPRVLDYLSGAKRDTAQIQIERLSEVLDLYKLEVGEYPSTDQGLEALIEKPAGVSGWNGPYLKQGREMLVDPWGNPYQYRHPGGVSGWNGPYLKQGREMLVDPWGNPYQYRQPGEHGSFDLYSHGADGEPGGEGENADVTNWSSGDTGTS